MTLHKHRIIPGHMGGTYSKENVILLTVEQHAEAHKVLWETNGLIEDYLAWKGLAGLIGKDEILRLIPHNGWHHTKEFKQKIGNFHRGRKRSLETRQKMSQSTIGKPKPGAFGQIRNSYGCKGKLNKPVGPYSLEARQNMSRAHLGHKHSPETRQKMSFAKAGKPSNTLGKHWTWNKGKHATQ